MMEVELKAPAPRGVESRLVAAGAKKLSSKVQNDTLYDLPGEPLRRHGENLRIREEGRRLLVTFKGKSVSKKIKAKEEIELPVNGSMRVLLAGLGYSPTLFLRKFRAEYSLGKVTVCIDNVRGLGRWVEFEAFGEPAECRKRIVKAASMLGIAESALAPLSYATMMRERLKKGKR